METNQKEKYKNFLNLFYIKNIDFNKIKDILEENNFANGFEDDTVLVLPLYLALINKNLELAKLLLEYGADVNKSFGAITNNFIYGEDDMHSLYNPIISHLIEYQSNDVGSEANSLREATKMLKDTKEIEFFDYPNY